MTLSHCVELYFNLDFAVVWEEEWEVCQAWAAWEVLLEWVVWVIWQECRVSELIHLAWNNNYLRVQLSTNSTFNKLSYMN